MTNRRSHAQLEGLVDFLEQNPGIAKGLLRTMHGKLETMQCTHLSVSMRRTGGGTADDLPALTAMEKRLAAVMGRQDFARGDSRLTINPFPQSPRPTESPAETVEDTEMHYLRNTIISSVPGTSHNDAIPTSSTIPTPSTPLQSTVLPRQRRRRSSIPRPLDIEQLASLEARRVDAEMLTAQALAQLSANVGNIASSLTAIANSIADVAKKMP